MIEETLYRASALVLALGFLGSLVAASEIGFRVGRRGSQRTDEAARSQLAGIEAALLGLLALLLGFTISMSVTRFEERYHLVVEEANAIGTAYLRAGLVSAPDGATIANLLRDYVAVRLEPYDDHEVVRRTVEIQDDVWDRVTVLCRQDPHSQVASLLAQAVNTVIDMYGARVAALANRVPGTVILLVGAVAVLSLGVLGYGYGLGGHRHPFTMLTFSVAIVLVLVVIMDLDRPRRGFIRVRDQSMRNLREQIAPARR